MADSAASAQGLRSLVTPEGVDLRLQLGEMGQRFSALVTDLLFINIAIGVLIVALVIVLGTFGLRASEPAVIVWLVGGFLLRNFYFVAFEGGPRGATPGKRRMGLRVAARRGGRLTGDAVFARNAMRELELYLPVQVMFMPGFDIDAWIKLAALAWLGVFALFPLFNRDRLRVGDLLAGTWVVKQPTRRLLPDLARPGFDDRSRIAFTQAQIDAYGIKELQVLEGVLRRFDPATVRTVAERIRNKIGYEPGGESDGAFLDAYYAVLRARLEARALMGRRRTDKFDIG